MAHTTDIMQGKISVNAELDIEMILQGISDLAENANEALYVGYMAGLGVEHITRKEINKEEVKDRVMEEYLSMDKGTRILVYKTLLERFNSKYSDMSNTQKSVLKEYINNISNRRIICQ